MPASRGAEMAVAGKFQRGIKGCGGDQRNPFRGVQGHSGHDRIYCRFDKFCKCSVVECREPPVGFGNPLVELSATSRQFTGKRGRDGHLLRP